LPVSEATVPSRRLSGRIAVVTGAGQGLGRAFARRLFDEGARVVIADLDLDRARSVCAELTSDSESVVAVQVDVSNGDSVAKLAEHVRSSLGDADVLVNNASIFSTLEMRPFEEIPAAEWDQVMAVNVRGAFLCAQAFVPGMRAGGYGKIINISSSTVFFGRPLYLHYVTSKAAIIGMTRALATELGPAGITVNAITPGATKTEIPRKTVTANQAEQIIAAQAIKRREVPEDLVGAVAFLASADSDFITGQTLNVDGGAAYH
jgi:3-oxoacyl-[acyl-carrier protein] reductase